MALKVYEDHVENIWLADKERCDIVVCVTEKFNAGPSSKKRICAASAGGERHTYCDAVAKRALHSGQRFVKLHAVSEQLQQSPYFETCLKESWCKQKAKEGSLVELPLETLVASSKAYQRCIEILCSAEPCSAHMFSCPLQALDIYLASDHLLFKECSVACMEYLAAAPWSTQERKVIYETFSTSGIKPSEDMAARLGLCKEQPSENLSKTLWYLYEEAYSEDEEGESDRLLRFQDFITDLVEKNGMGNSNKSSKKVILEFLHQATDDCVQQLKKCMHIAADDWIYEKHFLGWLHMMQLILCISDGKEAVEAMACDEDLYALFIPTFDNILAEGGRSASLDDAHGFSRNAYLRTKYDIDLQQLMRVIVKVLKLLAEGFKRVAEAEIIVPESTRKALIMCWVPWLGKYHGNEIWESVNIPALKGHIYKILQTLSMNDNCVLRTLAKGAMDGDYLLEGAFQAWCDRLN